MQAGEVGGSAAALRKFFNRFKREELVDVAKDLDAGLDGAQLELPKARLLSALLARVGARMTYDRVARVDLRYAQLHGGRSWTSCTLGAAGAAARMEAGELAAALSRHLSPFFCHHVHAAELDGSVWVRVFIQDGVAPASQLTSGSNTVYLIYSAHSRHLFATRMKVVHRDYVSQALVAVFGCSKVEVNDLTARSVDVLKELTHHQHSQGVYGEYRRQWHDSNPLAREAPRKRRRPNGASAADGDGLPGNATIEDADAIDERRDATDGMFGAAEQPELERVEFQLNTGFHGLPEYKLSGRFRGRVKIEGSSVISGLSELIAAGAADAPLPPLLADLHSSARNKFAVTEE